MKAVDLSKHVISYFEYYGDLITNKKLQKLLYYIQAWGLVYFEGGGIIDEDFEAWVHGPVIPSVYNVYCECGFSPLKSGIEKQQPLNGLKHVISPDKIKLIDAVLKKYGSLSSMELELMSHSESPWIDARGECEAYERCNTIISKESIKAYYSGLREK